MKGGCKVYPNQGVKIDPRTIASGRMPESLKVFSGQLNYGYNYLVKNGYCIQADIDKIIGKPETLEAYNQSRHKFKSSYWCMTDFYIIEFFRTSMTNYKIYALRILFFQESPSLDFLKKKQDMQD